MKMKTLFLVLITSLGFIPITQGQDFKPGQESTGASSPGQTGVDHATGIFHYSVPLLNITSDGYSLPVSLNYVGRGVQRDMLPGMYGYNWNLNTGGVVSRTIRGGFADEQNKGVEGPSTIIPPTHPEPAPNCYVEESYDTEHDIFTASFNGKTVNFIINKEQVNGTTRFIAKALEKTHVKIEPGTITQDTLGFLIDGWIITDTDGVRYIYKQKEWIINAGTETITNRFVSNDKHVSAWYLTEIDIPNADNIYYWYNNSPEYPYRRPTAPFAGVYAWEKQEYIFHYAYPHKEFYANYGNIRYEVECSLSDLNNAISEYTFKENINNRYGDFNTTLTEFYINPYYNYNLEKIKFHKSLQNFVADIETMGESVQGLINILNLCLSEFENDYNIKDNISNIKGLIHSMFLSAIQYNDEEEQQVTKRRIIQTPILECITCKNHYLQFNYTSINFAPRLTSICLTDNDYHSINRYEFEYSSSHNLNKITKIDTNDCVIDWQTFSYYHEGGGDLYDKWGYHSSIQSVPHPFNQDGAIGEIDAERVKTNSLQRITYSKGGFLTINYEPNERADSTGIAPYGGLRLKSIVSTTDGISDSTTYSYPGGGILVYPEVSNVEYVKCLIGNLILQDTIVSSIVNYKGGACVNTGNNGLYYPYVEEHLAGRGWNTYLFSVFQSSGEYTETFPFWLCGIPLAKACYNENGNLLLLQKNKYCTDYSGYLLNIEPTNWFEQAPSDFTYSEHVTETKIHNYHFNYDEMKSYYTEHASIPIIIDIQDEISYSYPAYDLFRFNFDRYEINHPCFGYNLYYGGLTTLISQKEYHFSGQVSTSPSIIHLTGTLPSGAHLMQDITYFYENQNSWIAPTRVEKVISNGKIQVEINRTPLDFEKGAIPEIDSLVSRNMIGAIIKKRLAIKEANSSTCMVQNEEVNIFEPVSGEGNKREWLLKKHLVSPLLTGQQESTASFSLEQSLHSFPVESYLTETYDYRLLDNSFVREVVDNWQSSSVTFYNNIYHLPVFQAQNVSPDRVDAFDILSYQPSEYHIRNYNQIVSFYDEVFPFKEDFFHYLSISQTSWNKILEYAHAIKELYDYNVLSDIASQIKPESVDSLYMYYANINPSHKQIVKFSTSLKTLLSASNQSFYRDFIKSVQYQAPAHHALSVSPRDGRYRVMLLVKPNSASPTFSLNYKIINGEEETQLSTPSRTTTGEHWQLVVFDINLDNVQNNTKLEVEIPSSIEVRSGVLVPMNQVFEMKAYDNLNRLVSSFNQNGQVTLYEYDTAGRVTRVLDQDGNILQEFTYNIVLQP